MLEDIWKGEKTALAGLDAAQQLSDVARIRTIYIRPKAKDLLKKPMLELFIADVRDLIPICPLTE